MPKKYVSLSINFKVFSVAIKMVILLYEIFSRQKYMRKIGASSHVLQRYWKLTKFLACARFFWLIVQAVWTHFVRFNTNALNIHFHPESNYILKNVAIFLPKLQHLQFRPFRTNFANKILAIKSSTEIKVCYLHHFILSLPLANWEYLVSINSVKKSERIF